MNRTVLLPLVIIIGGAIIGGALLLSGNGSDSPDVVGAQAGLRKVTLAIRNMVCIGCRSSVVNAVMALPGVVQADADPRTDSGWVIYNPAQITKEQIIGAPIFQTYPVRIVTDEEYSSAAHRGDTAKIPPGIEQKRSLLARKLQERGGQLEPFFRRELDDAIRGGYWDKANTILDNLLRAYEQN